PIDTSIESNRLGIRRSSSMHAEEKPPDREEFVKLVGRLAALEDKLAKLQITEEECKAYLKVAAMLGGQAKSPYAESGPGTGSAPQVHWHYHWAANMPLASSCCWRPCGAVAACLPGPSSWGGPVTFGGEFKDLGT